MNGVDGDYIVEEFSGLRVILGIDRVVREQEQTGNVVRVGLQRRRHRRHHRFPVAIFVGEGPASVKVRVFRQLLQALLEGAGGQGEIMLLQRELTAGEVDVTQLRIDLLRRRVYPIEDILRIGAEQQRRPAKDDEIRREAVHPRATGHETRDFLRSLGGFLRFTIGQSHLA